jgi:hypothetical protein
MSNNTAYFNRTTYKSTYSIGDRVSVRWNGMLFMGTVGNDRLVNEEHGPEITVHLDLPYIDDGDQLHTIMVVDHTMIKPMRVFE